MVSPHVCCVCGLYTADGRKKVHIEIFRVLNVFSTFYSQHTGQIIHSKVFLKGSINNGSMCKVNSSTQAF